jgi:hypothetical protein
MNHSLFSDFNAVASEKMCCLAKPEMNVDSTVLILKNSRPLSNKGQYVGQNSHCYFGNLFSLLIDQVII